MKITDFQVGDVVGICPRCKHELIIKEGKYGKFIACNNYPRCKNTYNYGNFRIQEEMFELIDLDKAELYETIKNIMTNTHHDIVRQKCNEKLTEYNYCLCGERITCNRIYRTTPDYPHYLKEYYCPVHGYFIMTETPTFKSFCRYGRLEQHHHDDEILGGYWI